jgi:uncharacterized FlaG/YvyC family protein
MAAITPSQPVLNAPRAAKTATPAAGSAKKAERRAAEPVMAAANDATSHKLSIELDKDAGRFVQVITDELTSETVRRYPSESQLAYSRAVMAYLRTQLAK